MPHPVEIKLREVRLILSEHDERLKILEWKAEIEKLKSERREIIDNIERLGELTKSIEAFRDMLP